MKNQTRAEKIQFLKDLQAGRATIDDLKGGSVVVIVHGEMHENPADSLYEITGTSHKFTFDEYKSFIDKNGFDTVLMLPAKAGGGG